MICCVFTSLSSFWRETLGGIDNYNDSSIESSSPLRKVQYSNEIWFIYFYLNICITNEL